MQEKNSRDKYSLADPEQYKAFIEAGGYEECLKWLVRLLE